jgi:hypothetical protein
MKKVLLASAGALALCAAFASAASAQVSGTVAGNYANVTNSGGGDIWGVDGSLAGMFGSNWGAEAAGGYHDESGGGGSIWNIGGSVFWQGMKGRIAATYQYHDITGANFSSYGVGGEFYAAPNFTVAAHGGGESGSGTSGGYAGAMLQWYAMPNLSIDGSVDYLQVGSGADITSETIKAEWLISNNTPVSIYGGYQHVDLGAGPGSDANVVFVGVKLYMNGSGGSSLVDRQRNGAPGYITQSPLFLDQY